MQVLFAPAGYIKRTVPEDDPNTGNRAYEQGENKISKNLVPVFKRKKGISVHMRE